MACLDDTAVLRLISGELGPDELGRVDAHLDTCDTCRAVVATLAGGGQGDAGDGAAAGALARGATVGRYVIEDAVGGGAMGVVYAARDPTLDRRVALKLLRGEDAEGPEARQLLLREAQAMARLQHPNVVTVYEVGAVGDRVFLAMELVAGTTLRDWMRPGRSASEICEVMAQAGRGLSAAHAAGLVHRDVKPDNVIVGDDGRVRVGDFGLSRGAEPRPSAPVSMGETPNPPAQPAGRLVGTPAYMAPEALRGGAADARSDQFGFAVTFFEALHGERPFGGRSVAELLSAIELGRPVTPRRPAPPWLSAIVRRALSARPEDRFPSLEAMLGALEDRRRARGRRRLGGAAALLVAAVVGVVSFRVAARPSCDGGAAQVATVWGGATRARVAQALAGSEPDTGARAVAALDRWAEGWATAHGAVCRATRDRGEQSAELLDLRMRCLERRRREAGALVDRLGGEPAEGAHRAVDAVLALPDPDECRDLDAAGVDPMPHDPAAAAAAEQALAGLPEARAALLLRDPARALSQARALTALSERSGHAPTISEVALVRAEALRLSGDGRAAEEAAQASLWAAERGHDDLAAARAWLSLLSLAGERRDLRAAEERAGHAGAALARAGNPRALAARLDHARGLVAESQGRLDDAERFLTAALDRRRALHGDDDLEVARSLAALGGVARARGRLDEARRKLEEALEIDERRLGADHPEVARDLHNLGGVLRVAGDPDGALDRYTRALAIRRAALGEGHVDTALTHNSLGLLLLAGGRLDEAAREFAAALGPLERAHHGDRAIAQHNLGLTAARRGDQAEALRRFAEAEAVYRETLGEDSQAMARLRQDRAASERAAAASAPSPPGPAAPAAPSPDGRRVRGPSALGSTLTSPSVFLPASRSFSAPPASRPRSPIKNEVIP